ncbi:MAG: hypothetical protein A2Z34_02770 [Planctomycetes bacterium RBG_16_59_8]|nr:MAG: hypothetical protein A2Z34_02770 [Planctomycetes bacterium RBG_16_59_8]
MRQGNLANQNDWYFDERGERVEIAGVQNVGGRVFMKEGGVWNDTTVPPEATGEEIRYFSDEFFKLLAEHPELNRAAAIGEALNVQIREKTYALR